MDLFQALILGIVQGLGEFLPISSSGHLIAIPFLLNWEGHSLAFDVALHFGTLIAVLLIFYKDWLVYVKGAYGAVVNKKKSFESRMFMYLILATIPGALIGKLLESNVEEIFRKELFLIASALAFMGILIYLGDKFAEKWYAGKEIQFDKIGLKQSLVIGISQALAIIPGFSRSGTTMLTARLMGISREASAKFSFLLSVPIIFGATILKFGDLIKNINIETITGIVVSAIVGTLSIKFLLNYVKNKGFAIFAIYRFVLALIILVKILL